MDKLKQPVKQVIKENSSLRKELEDTLDVHASTILRWVYTNSNRLMELPILRIINKYMKYEKVEDLIESDINISNV